MIGYLDGVIKSFSAGKIVVVCGGVGYLVHIPARLLPKMKLGDRFELHVYTQVREDAINLYGFETIEEKETFEMLTGVSGVGPKTALNLLSGEEPVAIKKAIRDGDLDLFTSVPGIGKKNSQRIIIELRGKIGSSSDNLDFESNKEVLEALYNWGFDKASIKEALKSIDSTLPEVEQIRLALKLLNKNGR